MNGYEKHLEDFGHCNNKYHSGSMMMSFEFKNERTGRHYHDEVPACEECFGLKI